MMYQGNFLDVNLESAVEPLVLTILWAGSVEGMGHKN
jgi:hypothetical protein